MPERPQFPTELPTFSPTGDRGSLTMTAPKSLSCNTRALRDSNSQPSDPKSVGRFETLGAAVVSERQKATEGGQGSPLSHPLSHPARRVFETPTARYTSGPRSLTDLATLGDCTPVVQPRPGGIVAPERAEVPTKCPPATRGGR
jgi:hypothetical protein